MATRSVARERVGDRGAQVATLADFEIRSTPGLWRWYDQSARQLAFHAGSRAETEVWQETLRETLTRLLGSRPEPAHDLDPHMIESGKQEGFSWQFVVFQTDPGIYMPCYVLIPDNATQPYKPVIALHGHGTWGARGIVGLADSEMETEFVRLHNYDYARQFARRGFLVFAPVLRGFAERMEHLSQPVD